jgi:hypothetical protein
LPTIHPEQHRHREAGTTRLAWQRLQLTDKLTFRDVRSKDLGSFEQSGSIHGVEAEEWGKMMEDSGEKTAGDFSGVVTAAIVLPASLIVYHFGGADMAISTFLCLGMVVFAALLKWNLRKFVWFWIVLSIVTALQVPVILGVHWPAHWVHGVVLLPVCIVDLLILLGIIRLVEGVMLSKPLPAAEHE